MLCECIEQTALMSAVLFARLHFHAQDCSVSNCVPHCTYYSYGYSTTLNQTMTSLRLFSVLRPHHSNGHSFKGARPARGISDTPCGTARYLWSVSGTSSDLCEDCGAGGGPWLEGTGGGSHALDMVWDLEVKLPMLWNWNVYDDSENWACEYNPGRTIAIKLTVRVM